MKKWSWQANFDVQQEDALTLRFFSGCDDITVKYTVEWIMMLLIWTYCSQYSQNTHLNVWFFRNWHREKQLEDVNNQNKEIKQRVLALKQTLAG